MVPGQQREEEVVADPLGEREYGEEEGKAWEDNG